MQGTAADLIKLAMIDIDRWIMDKNSHRPLLLPVNDALVFEVAENDIENMSRIAEELMCGVVRLDVPLVVDVGVGKNWKEAH